MGQPTKAWALTPARVSFLSLAGVYLILRVYKQNLGEAVAIDYTTPVGMVRILIPDVHKLEDPKDLRKPESYVFTDEQIQAFLTINGGNVRFAAADAVTAIAVDIGTQMLEITSDDKQTQGSKMIKELNAVAESLRRRAKAEKDEADKELLGFDLIERRSCYDWAWRM